MTIASEIQRIQTNIANAYDALEAKGATMPATENTDNLVTTIDTISGGGGDIIMATNNTGSAITTGDKVWINQQAAYDTNFTVVGNPTINYSTGVVSGFSAGDYLTTSEPFNPSSNPWEIVICSSMNNTSGTTFFMGSRDSNLSFIIGAVSGVLYMWLSSNGSSWNIASGEHTYNISCPTSVYFYLKLSFTGTKYSLEVSTDKINWQTAAEVSSSSNMYPSEILLGNCYDLGGELDGSIDLSETYINVNGVSWWTPTFTKLSDYSIDIFDSDNTFIESYGKLSSTNISSSHIATISSYKNGIVAPIVFPFSTANTWEFVTRIKPSSSLSSQTFGIFFCADYQVSQGVLELLTKSGAFMFVQNGQTIIFQGSVGSQVDWGVGISLSGYDWVYVKGEFTGSEYKLSTSTDGVTWSEPQTTTSSVICAQPTCSLRIGSPNYSDSYSYKGYIDLTKTYLKVNDEIVWRAVCKKPSLTGYAQENITSGSTGDVLTLLPPEPASKKKRLVSVADNLDTNKLVLYTDDGINWNTSTMPNSRNWGHPFYGDGKFIVADYQSGIFAYSSDGINWTEGTAFSTQYNTYTVLKGAYGNGVYLLACNTGNTGTGYLFKSTDGINWTNGYNFFNVSDSPGKMIDFIFDGNRFIAFFEDHACQYSTDGVSWTKAGRPFNSPYEIPNNRATTIYDSVNSRYIHSVAFYASGTTATYEQHIYTSTDLTNWTEVFSVAYNNVAPVTSCILDGETKIFSGWDSLSLQAAGYINVDSIGTATYVGSSVPRLNYQGGANVINDRAVVIGYGSDQYIYSTDGTTWNTGTLPASSGWWGSCVGEVD